EDAEAREEAERAGEEVASRVAEQERRTEEAARKEEEAERAGEVVASRVAEQKRHTEEAVSRNQRLLDTVFEIRARLVEQAEVARAHAEEAVTLAVGDTLATEARAETLQIELDVLHQTREREQEELAEARRRANTVQQITTEVEAALMERVAELEAADVATSTAAMQRAAAAEERALLAEAAGAEATARLLSVTEEAAQSLANCKAAQEEEAAQSLARCEAAQKEAAESLARCKAAQAQLGRIDEAQLGRIEEAKLAEVRAARSAGSPKSVPPSPGAPILAP
ncbi:hypothetical protein T484DRAFT_1767365, partial [Baffinella frigidus]